MFEEEQKGDEDDELEDIIEEANEDESEDSDGLKKNKKKKNKQDVIRQNQKEELKNLKTQMLSMQDQLNKKAHKIEELKTNLKQSSAIMKKQEGED
jgi:hypothetical protein